MSNFCTLHCKKMEKMLNFDFCYLKVEKNKERNQIVRNAILQLKKKKGNLSDNTNENIVRKGVKKYEKNFQSTSGTKSIGTIIRI